MDFGLIYELGVPRDGDRSEYDVYWNGLQQAVAADKVGFTHVWAVEHHFLEEFSHSSAPEVWLSAVAQHTDRIRIGHGVVLVPPGFNHPVRVAERAAALDIMSNGRLEFGTGRSITEEELGGFGIDPAESRPQWREAVELIPKIWTTDGPITFHGTYAQLEDRPVLPKPIQKPHPPLWAACTSPNSYGLAGELGLGVLAFGMAISPEAMGRRIDEYRAGLAQATPVGSVVNDNIAVFLMACCAPTDSEAREIAEESFNYYMDQSMKFFLHWGRGGDLPPGYEWYAEAAKNRADLADRVKFDYLLDNGMILCGSPSTIREQIEPWKQAGASQILLGAAIHKISHESALQTIGLVGESVIPHFRRTTEPAAI